MASLRHPVSVSGLAALALIAGLAQAPARAQANALQELSRQMIGSSFDNNNSPTALPGSPSLVEGGSESSGRVVGDLVDQEILRRPTPVKPVAAKNGPKTVQLLVPVRTGLEFAQIEKLIPGVKILEMNGGVFVLVSETPQALTAYQKGRDLQAKLGVPFQLAYSDGHPDLNLAWMGALNADLATAPKPVSTQKPVAVTPAPPKPGKAQDLGLLVVQAPWVKQSPAVEASSALSQKPSLDPNGEPRAEAKPELARRVAPAPVAPAAIEQNTTKAVPFAAEQPKQPGSIALTLQQPTEAKPAVELKPEPAAVAQGSSKPSLNDTLAELRAMRQHSTAVAVQTAPANQTVSASTEPASPARSAPLVQAVAIKPANLGDIPLVSSRFMALNQDLAYVYVKVQTGTEIAAVNRVAPVAVVHDRDGQLLARVGVYTNTRVGQRLRNQQLKQLQQRGYDVELIAGIGLTASNSKA